MLSLRSLLVAVFVVAFSAAPGHADEIIRIPVDGSFNGMATRLCLPERPGGRRVPLAVINHGSPGDARERAFTRPWPCTSQVARFFLSRGYAVAFPLRRGYGETGGPWIEEFGTCGAADFVRGGRGTAADILAAVAALHARPEIAAGRTIVVGHSAGGFGTIAAAAAAPDGVIGFVNVAGGRGGRRGSARDDSTCSPAALASAAGTFGGSARRAMLWVYADNDSFFSPRLVQSMHAAFTQAGGRAELRRIPAFGSDGHRLFSGGGVEVWGPIIDRYMRTLR